MSDIETVKDDLGKLVETYGIHLIVDIVMGLASGSTIGEVVEQVERHAIRIAADIQAQETLR